MPAAVPVRSVTATLAAAAAMLRVRTTFAARLDRGDVRVRWVRGGLPDLAGRPIPSGLGAGPWLTDAAARADPDAVGPLIRSNAAGSWLAVPARTGDGRVVGLLGGFDHATITITELQLACLQQLAGVLGTYLVEPRPVAVGRSVEGWRVVGTADRVDSAVVLAAMLAADLHPPPPQHRRPAGAASSRS